MEYLNNDILYSLLKNIGCFEEDVARIYVAELVYLTSFPRNSIKKFTNFSQVRFL